MVISDQRGEGVWFEGWGARWHMVCSSIADDRYRGAFDNNFQRLFRPYFTPNTSIPCLGALEGRKAHFSMHVLPPWLQVLASPQPSVTPAGRIRVGPKGGSLIFHQRTLIHTTPIPYLHMFRQPCSKASTSPPLGSWEAPVAPPCRRMFAGTNSSGGGSGGNAQRGHEEGDPKGETYQDLLCKPHPQKHNCQFRGLDALTPPAPHTV